MNPNRGAFLATAAVGAALLADAQPARATKPFRGDFPGMLAVLGRPAQHRILVGAPFIHGGNCLRTAHALTAYEFVNGAKPESVNFVISLYGPASVMMLMDDAWWTESKAFELCEELGELPRTATNSARNPFYLATSSLNPNDDPHDPKGYYQDMSVEALTKRGARWLICANALEAAALLLRRLNNGGDTDAYIDQMISHLLPKTTVVPSGYQSLVVAQEQFHFAYIAAH